MKTILLIALALVLANGVSAQVGGTPRELTCTEEAFNFKVNIKSGWHLSQVSMGPSGLPKGTPDYMAVRSFNEAAPGTEPIYAGDILMITHLQHTVNLHLPDSLQLPNTAGYQVDKFNYGLPNYTDFPQFINYNYINKLHADLK